MSGMNYIKGVLFHDLDSQKNPEEMIGGFAYTVPLLERKKEQLGRHLYLGRTYEVKLKLTKPNRFESSRIQGPGVGFMRFTIPSDLSPGQTFILKVDTSKLLDYKEYKNRLGVVAR